jgi:hypothetical protein
MLIFADFLNTEQTKMDLTVSFVNIFVLIFLTRSTQNYTKNFVIYQWNNLFG